MPGVERATPHFSKGRLSNTASACLAPRCELYRQLTKSQSLPCTQR
jgi:hypothetical protein